MYKTFKKAVRNATNTLKAVQADVRGQELTEVEVVERYLEKHRGRPDAIMRFVKRMSPEGEDPLEAAAHYEEEMEGALLDEQWR